jgi:hypothetical protein
VPHDAPLFVLGFAEDEEPIALFRQTFSVSMSVDSETVLAVIRDALAGEAGAVFERDVAPIAPAASVIPPNVGGIVAPVLANAASVAAAEALEEQEAIYEWKVC